MAQHDLELYIFLLKKVVLCTIKPQVSISSIINSLLCELYEDSKLLAEITRIQGLQIFQFQLQHVFHQQHLQIILNKFHVIMHTWTNHRHIMIVCFGKDPIFHDIFTIHLVILKNET